MPKYIKLTEALDAVSWDTESYTAINMLDTVEIIRCKDCKHYYFADNRVEAEQCHVCGYWDFDSPSPNGFCSFAEK